ncbi:MarR family transcriptional regulator [Microlunatus spumicola]|uniref:MarR family transcriptional regulator n=1 Tax=Microlunatus spumicola TaxID=81499 RepID=UPI00195ED49B
MDDLRAVEPSGDLPYQQILVASRLIGVLTGRRLEHLGVSPGQLAVLLELYRRDGLQPSELAQRTGVEASTMTLNLARMERDDLVRRRPHASDRRSTTVWLTERAKGIRGEVTTLRAEIEAAVVEPFDEATRRLLSTHLNDVVARLQALTAVAQDADRTGSASGTVAC